MVPSATPEQKSSDAHSVLSCYPVGIMVKFIPAAGKVICREDTPAGLSSRAAALKDNSWARRIDNGGAGDRCEFGALRCTAAKLTSIKLPGRERARLSGRAPGHAELVVRRGGGMAGPGPAWLPGTWRADPGRVIPARLPSRSRLNPKHL